MSEPVSSGKATTGAHLRQLAKSRGVDISELPGGEVEDDDPPQGCEWVWAMFLELHAGRSYGQHPNPISYTELESFGRLVGIEFEMWEVNAIRGLDRTWLKVHHGRSSTTGD